MNVRQCCKEFIKKTTHANINPYRSMSARASPRNERARNGGGGGGPPPHGAIVVHDDEIPIIKCVVLLRSARRPFDVLAELECFFAIVLLAAVAGSSPVVDYSVCVFDKNKVKWTSM